MAGALVDFGLQFVRDLTIAVVLAGAPLLGRYWLSHRGKLSFLGVGTLVDRLRSSGLAALMSNVRVKIYVSSIVVKHLDGGATEACVAIDKGFSGPAITEREYGISIELASRIGAQVLPLGTAPSDLGGWQLPFNRILCPIEPSPWPPPATTPGLPPPLVFGARSRDVVRVDFNANPQLEELVTRRLRERGTILVVGSPIYNAVSAFVLQTFRSEFAFIKEARRDPKTAEIYYVRGIRINDPHGAQLADRDFMRRDDRGTNRRRSPAKLDEHFIVEKFTNRGGRQGTVFICAGMGASATAAAVHLLADWSRLRRAFGDRDFALLGALRIDSAADRDSTRTFDDMRISWTYDKGRGEVVTL
jgi:hypothetical protein